MDVNKPDKNICIHGKWFEPYINAEAIQQKVSEAGTWLRDQYATSVPVFLSILNGSVFFAADVIRAFGRECEISFIKMHSYRGTESTGNIQVPLGLNHPIEGRDVIILEDITDTGRTIHHLLGILAEKNPASLRVVTLLDKPSARIIDIPIAYTGFTIENKFIVGYGLDYDQYGRNLPAIYKELEKDNS